ncbi:MAG: DUF3619 family protein [Proteobacteria bacterium]|nr:DUF3619 family protein [Pseudomonadota bacterium]
MDNELQFAHRVRQVLNGNARVDGPVAERLRTARNAALERRKIESTAGAALAGNVLGRVHAGGLSLRVIVPVLALSVAFAVTYSWGQKQRAAEVEELDALLLTGDLPIDAYLDQGFESWLKRRAAH